MKKLIITILSFVCVLACALCLAACGGAGSCGSGNGGSGGGGGNGGNSGDGAHTHEFIEYVYNDDATCGKDGTETAKCKYCDETDTRTSAAHPATGEHNYVEFICTVCKDVSPDAPVTEGLKYIKVEKDNEIVGYSVSKGSAGSNKYIKIPNTYNDKPVVSIGKSAFSNCKSLIIVVIPNSVTSIGQSAFSGCTGLTSLTIGNSVTSIGEYAFRGCTGLMSLTIGNSVTSIGQSAFSGCNSLTIIVIPNSVTSIGQFVFSGCSSLTGITVQSGNTKYHSAGNCLIETANKILLAGCKSSVIPTDGSVTSIGDGAFQGCIGLISITIPSSVTSVGQSAFSGCSSLIIFCEAVSKPSGWNSTGCPVVWDCNNNDKATDGYIYIVIDELRYGLKDGKATVVRQSEAVSGSKTIRSSVTHKDVSYSVTSIGGYAFDGCSSLTSIEIPDSVTSIGDSAFRGLRGLAICCEAASEPSGWHYYWNISKCPVVWDCKNNDKATDGYIYIVIDGLRYGLKDGEATVVCQSEAVSGSITLLSSVTYKDVSYSVTSIGRYAFHGCSSLTSITIPNSLTSIGDSAFSGCSGITSIEIPNSVTSIGDSAFSGCSGITSIEIPNSVTSIGDEAFSGCSGLTSITVQSGNTKYHSVDNCLIETARKILIAGCKNSVIPTDGSVTSIGLGAFAGCIGLTSIEIPDSVTCIGEGAFWGCIGLTSITLPFVGNSVKASSDSNYRPFGHIFGTGSYEGGMVVKQNFVFGNVVCYDNYCIPTSLKSVKITGGDLLDGAFYNCCGLTSIEILDSVTRIEEDVFWGCSSLTSITIPNSVTNIGQYVFNGCNSLIIYCEAASKPSGWNNYWNNSKCPVVWDCKNNDKANDGYIYIVIDGLRYGLKDGKATVVRQSKAVSGSIIIPSSVTYKDVSYSVTSIGDSAFAGCIGLTSIDIPNSVTSIGEYAFSGCTGLTSIEIPDSVTNISQGVFYGCSSLTGIEIPNSVKYIGYYAFRDCNSLTSIEIPNSVTNIGKYAFDGCSSLTIIKFDGTKAQWKAITKGDDWNLSTGKYTITCADGTLSK